MGDDSLYDGPEYDANEPDWDAMPVIVCEECGAEVYADFPGDRYCVPCAMEIAREAREADRARCLVIEAETLALSLDDVPW